MGGSLDRQRRRRHDHHRRRRAERVRPADGRRWSPTSSRNPKFPESELPRLKANMLAQPRGRAQPAAAARAPEVPRRDLRRPRLRPGVPDRGDDQGLHARAGPRLLQRRPTAPAARGSTSSAGSTRRRWRRPIRKAFAGWAKGTPAVAAAAEADVRRAPCTSSIARARRSRRSSSGMPTVDPSNADFIPLTVMDALLGGAFASRITKNIREDKGYTYSPYSELSVRYRDAYWAENADVTTTVTGPSIKEIFAEIDRLQAEPPSKEELTGIQNYLAGHLRAAELQPRRHHQPAAITWTCTACRRPTPSTYVKQVYAVTPQQVTEMAKKHLQDDQAHDRHRRRSQGDRGAGQGVRQHHGQVMPEPPDVAGRARFASGSSAGRSGRRHSAKSSKSLKRPVAPRGA